MQECPLCGIDCYHDIGQRQIFAYEALEEAGKWYDRERTRGASDLIGVTIVSVHTTCINQITLAGSDGHLYVFDTEPSQCGIDAIVVSKVDTSGL